MIDLHIDPILQQRLFGYDVGRAHRAGLPGQPLFWHSDLPRMIQGGYKGACLGLHYYPWQSERAWAELQRQLDYLDELAAREPRARRVRAPQDWQVALDQGQLALAPGVEGAHMLNGDLRRVQALAERGVAYMTLAHFGKNDAVTPSWGKGANDRDGLTSFGQELVAELERCDILVDVAHVNHRGVLDVCARATRPVLCTHTGFRAMRDVRRNLSDEAIDAIRATGGLIGVICAPMFMSRNLWASSERVLDGVEFILKRVGEDHVALGTDFDGWLWTIPRDMRDCRDWVKLPQGLARRGYSQAQIDKITHLNALRFLSRAW